jgi:hypothetical protein
MIGTAYSYHVDASRPRAGRHCRTGLCHEPVSVRETKFSRPETKCQRPAHAGADIGRDRTRGTKRHQIGAFQRVPGNLSKNESGWWAH